MVGRSVGGVTALRAVSGSRGSARAPRALAGRVWSWVSSAGARAWDRGSRVASAVRRHPVRAGAAGAAGAGVAATCVWALWFGPFLRVDHVDVAGVPAAERAAVSARLADLSSTPLVEVDTEEVAARVAAAAPVRDVGVSRRWPSGVSVHADPLVPVVALTGPAGRVELLAADGAAFVGDRVPAGVPVVRVAASSASAAPATAEVRAAALAVVSALRPDQRAAVERMSVTARGRVDLRVGSVDVAWGDASGGALKAAVLERFWRAPGVSRVDVSAPATPAVVTSGP